MHFFKYIVHVNKRRQFGPIIWIPKISICKFKNYPNASITIYWLKYFLIIDIWKLTKIGAKNG